MTKFSMITFIGFYITFCFISGTDANLQFEVGGNKLKVQHQLQHKK